MAVKKKSVKQLLVDRKLAPDLTRAEGLVMGGKVRSSGEIIKFSGALLPIDAELTVTEDKPFASRAGAKLLHALDRWQLSPQGLICTDVGSSTGGFTDLLLQRGATKVYSIDVGYGELAWHLRQDPRVVVMERTNAREVDALPEPIQFVSIDVSFISLRLILPAVQRWLTTDAQVVALVKPQFEAAREDVPNGGIIIDPETHAKVLRTFVSESVPPGLFVQDLLRSPITGQHGNVEFLAWLKRVPKEGVEIEKRVRDVVFGNVA